MPNNVASEILSTIFLTSNRGLPFSISYCISKVMTSKTNPCAASFSLNHILPFPCDKTKPRLQYLRTRMPFLHSLNLANNSFVQLNNDPWGLLRHVLFHQYIQNHQQLSFPQEFWILASTSLDYFLSVSTTYYNIMSCSRKWSIIPQNTIFHSMNTNLVAETWSTILERIPFATGICPEFMNFKMDTINTGKEYLTHQWS